MMTKALMIAAMMLGTAMTCAAMDSSDLLFHLSFDNGLTPELARGSAPPVTTPTELNRRLVGGLFGKGYLFAGKGSGIEYATGNAAGPSACEEMYTTPANFFGDSGTVAFWVKPLTNLQDQTHYIFLCNGPSNFFQIMKEHYWAYHYAGSDIGITDGTFMDEWLHFAVVFQKGHTQVYMNGQPGGYDPNVRVLLPTPAKFLIASGVASNATPKGFVDDMILGEVQIFRRPLSPEEIHSLFERGHATVVSPPGYGDPIRPQRGTNRPCLQRRVLLGRSRWTAICPRGKECPPTGGLSSAGSE